MTIQIPEFGNYSDNETALNIALSLLDGATRDRGVQILRLLERHIVRTGEVKSLTVLLPRVRALMSRYDATPEDTQPPRGDVLGIVASEGRRTPANGPTMAALVLQFAEPFQRSSIISERDTFEEVFRQSANPSPAVPFRLLRSAKAGGLIEMAGLLADGVIPRLFFLASPSDLDNSDARTLVRSGVRDNVETLITYRSISDALSYERGNHFRARHRPQPEHEGIAIVAHPECKLDCMNWLVKNAREIVRFRQIFTTGTTGKWVARFLDSLGLPSDHVYSLKSGPDGGDEQLCGQLMSNRCHHVVFFIDPQWAGPHEAAVFSLLKTCTTADLSINLRLNERSASAWIRSYTSAA